MRFRLLLLFCCSIVGFSVLAIENSKSVNALDKAAALKEVKKTSRDYLLGTKEFMAEIQSLIANKKYMEKLDIEEKFESQAEDLAVLEDANRKSSIRLFEEYISKYPFSKYVPDVLYKLGQLYFEDSSERLIRETENYEKMYQKFLAGEIGVLPAEPVSDYSKSLQYLKKLVKDYRDFRFRDNALYLLGYAYFEEGSLEEAVKVFDRLVEEYPKSDKLPEVYTRLGEYYFDAEDFKKSIYYYSHVLEYPDSVYYDKVLYKIAWSYYKLRKVVDATDFFVSLVDFYNRKYGPENDNTLKKEALNYIAVGFADYGEGVSQAYSFFRRISGRPYEFDIMEKIAELYNISDRLAQCVDSVDFIARYYSSHKRMPTIYEKKVSCLEQGGKISEADKARQDLMSMFGKGSEWREKNRDDTFALINADKIIEKHIIASALAHQKEGDETKRRSSYIRAATIYYNFLNNFPASEFAYGARYNYAEILYNLGDYEGAIVEHTRVVRNESETLYREPSSFAIVSSWHNVLKMRDAKYRNTKLEAKRDEKNKLLPPQRMSGLEDKMVRQCDEYEKLNPGSKRLPLVLYIKAEVFFRNNDLVKARDNYQRIVAEFPDEKISIDAAKNIIATYNYEGNYAMVEEWSKKLLASEAVAGSKKDLKEIKGLLTGSLFKSAQLMEEASKPEEAAKEYIRLAEQYPDSEYSDAALFNAAVTYEKIGNNQKAMEVYATMVAKYPKSKHSGNAMYRLANSQEQQLDFDKAVKIYEDIPKKYRDSNVVADSYYNAARLRRANNQFDLAANDLILYHNKISDKSERALTLFEAAKLYERAGMTNQAIRTYDFFITRNASDLDKVMESMVKKGRLYEQNGNRAAAMREYVKAIDTFKKSGSPPNTLASHFSAEARFRLINSTVADYEEIKLKSANIRNMKRYYEKKEKYLNKIVESFVNIVSLGSAEWSVASLYMIGYVFQEFAKFLYEAPVPKEINTEQLRQEYQSQLQTQAMPYEDKAIEYYEKAISEAARLKVINEWSKKARYQLSFLKPDQYSIEKDEIAQVAPSIDIKDYGVIGE